MLQENQTQSDSDAEYDREIKIIDEAILACKRDFEDLVYKRHEIIARRFGIDVMELINFIAKNGDVPQEAADIITAIAKKKKEQARRSRYQWY